MKETFETVAVFTYSSEAQIFKGRLESEGIEVFMADQHTINTDPLVSNAIGGVKLKVRSEDFERAKNILKFADKYSVTDQGVAIHCPKCDSEKVVFASEIRGIKSLISFLIGLVFGVLPFYVKYSYRCENCGEKFNINE
ncbi:DUF2007 domain-containing protein [Gillisia sp. M10.2A]|uniref:DUF2007 domain-containing protein n=1 Tax=Gillisia lutea TaxID=2909668 RepID=A0ABS9EC62_9FLAO|nr:DUF2007 domain-containing protein [Gillisia lutea]MCF4100460.1 DUF2007 domain-containing protein [Gillisia lutea]